MNILQKIKTYLKNNRQAYKLFELLEKSCNMYIIGGILREISINGEIKDIKDIDIIIDIIDKKSFNKILNQYKYSTNAFGGYKIIVDNIKFDIWKIQDTWAYKSRAIPFNKENIIENLQYTVFLNIDSIVYDVQNNILYDNLFKDCIKTNKLDIVLEKNPFIDLNILRAIVLKYKYKMNYSDKLKRIIQKEYKLKSFLFIDRLMEIQNNRYNKTIISKRKIQLELNNI